MNFTIFSWNCQGYASVKFPRIFHEYNMKHKPDIICLLELRVSMEKADSIIAKLGFRSSHRVEAIGYSRGIWLGWKDLVNVEVVQTHSQFILAKVWEVSSPLSIYMSFIHDSPNRQKHKDLWKDLGFSILTRQTLWIAIEDAILSSFEKFHGLSNGKRCPHIVNFVDKAELHDLGFKGIPFT